MARQPINLGSGANSGDGEGLRSAFTKVESNFGELYAHADSTSNPHNVTPVQIGAVQTSMLEIPSGVATLDGFGRLKNSQRPIYSLDQIVVGDLGFSLTPNTTSNWDLGTTSKKWNNIHANQIITPLFQANSSAITVWNAPINFSNSASLCDLLQINGKTAMRKISTQGGLQIGCDDILVLGAGEAAQTVASNSASGSEEVRIGADSLFSVFTNLQNGWASRKILSFDGNGVLTVEGVTLRPWTTADTDIDALIPGASVGSILEGPGSGHFVVGIRSNDPGDGFYVLDKGDAPNPITDPYVNVLLEVDRNAFAYRGNSVLHSGNFASFLQGVDGAGSAFDADLLDGQQGSFYQNATNINAGTLGSAYLPTTITQATAFSSNVSVAGTLIVADGTQTVPALMFAASPGSGIYASATDQLTITLGGSGRMTFTSGGMRVQNPSGAYVLNEASSATNPTIAPNRNDTTTGLGGVPGEVSLIANSIEIVRVNNSAVTINRPATVTGTLTATTFIGDHAWANVTGKPSTVDGYGITDAVKLSGNQTIAGTKTFDNVAVSNATIGNLVVTGTTTTVNSVNLDVTDPIITVGKDNTSASVPYLGIKAERGTSDAFWVWNEASDRWMAGLSTDDLGSVGGADVQALRLIATATGATAPLVINSNALVTNLNSDLLDSQEGSFYQNATNMNAGTLNDARLPTTMSAKTFQENIRIDSAANGGFISIAQRGTNNGVDTGLNLLTQSASATDGLGSGTTKGWSMLARSAVRTTYPNDYMLSYWDGGVWSAAWQTNAITRATDFKATPTVNGVAIVTTANYGAGNGIDSDRLDGQEGSFYQNATNMNAGTLNDARLPSTMTSKTFSGQIISTVASGTPPLVVASTNRVVNLNADLLDGLDSTAFALATHKYHAFANGQYFFDTYEQPNYFRLFTEVARSDTARFGALSSVEYWDGSQWTAWSGGDTFLQPLFDGREETTIALPHDKRKFRFVLTKNTGWPTMAIVVLQSTWSAISYPSTQVTLENQVTGVWTVKEVCDFGTGTTSNSWGMHAKTTGNLHDGQTQTRVTIDITDWVDSGAYTTAPLQRFMILSNYQGSALEPWTWNYNRVVDFKAVPTVNGVSMLTTSNYGAGNGIDADKLDGQDGSFYQNASNMNAGTLNDARLPATMSAKTFTGPVLVANGSATAPTLGFTDNNNTGFYLSALNNLSLTIGGSNRFTITSTSIRAATGTGPALMNQGATATVPGLVPNRNDSNTGIGGASGELSLINTSSESVKITNAAVTINRTTTITNAVSFANTLSVTGAVSFGNALTVTNSVTAASFIGSGAGLSNLAWANIVGTPTTLVGYGITDALSLTGGTLTGALVLNADPVGAMEAATKQYVDNNAQGLRPKESVRVATTGNITLSGLQTIDGVTLVAGDRVLVKDQTTQAQNGVYVAASGAWARATDLDAWGEIPGAYVFVNSGAINVKTGWTTNVILGGTLETTAIVWVQFSSVATYTGSNGIVLVASDFRLTGQALALHNLGTSGLIARTGSGTVASRSIAVPAAGLSITNADGVSGNPTLALANDLAALEGLSSNGYAKRTGTDTWTVNATIPDADLPGTMSLSKTFTGAVTISKVGLATSSALTITGDTSQNRYVVFQTGTSTRWSLAATSAAETGSNAGSDFSFNRYDDTGTYLDTPFQIIRGTGRPTFNNLPYYGSNAILHTGSMGAGSGINADLLDNLDSTAFLRANTATATFGNGISNASIILSFANPGVGYSTGFNFGVNSDSAGLNVTSYASDSSIYEFWLADNPDGTADMFSWRINDWQGSGGAYQPLSIKDLNVRFIGKNTQFYSSFVQQTSAFFTTGDKAAATTAAQHINFINDVSKLKVNTVGTVTITALDVSGYTGTTGNVVWIKLTSATQFEWGYGSYSVSPTPVETGMAVSTSATTLSNGIRVTFSSTSTGQAGDTFQFRVYTAPGATLGNTTVNGNLATSGTMAATGSVILNAYSGALRFNSFNANAAYIHGPSGGGDNIMVLTRKGTASYDVGFTGDLFSGSNKFMHTGNGGAGSLFDADKLDGQEGSFYQNASNINNGTISDTFLPTWFTFAKSFGANVTVHGQLLANSSASASAPAYSFNGDTTTGLNGATGVLSMVVGGSTRFQFTGGAFRSSTSTGPQINNGTPSSTSPAFIPNRSDANTGVGAATAGKVSLIANSTEIVQVSNASVIVSAPLIHGGLVPTLGSNIDQILSVSDTLTLSTSWQDTSVNAAELQTGTYIVQVLVSDVGSGGTQNNEYYSGVMSWYAGDTNETTFDEILLHKAGVANGGNAVFLQVQRTLTADANDLKLQISSTNNDSTSSMVTLKFRRMI